MRRPHRILTATLLGLGAAAWVGTTLWLQAEGTPIDVGQLTTARAPASGPLRVHAANPRYFEDGAGRPVYLVGSHTWNNFQEVGLANPPDAFDFPGYLQFLQDHGHNFIRLWRYEVSQLTDAGSGRTLYATPHPWMRSGTSLAADGQPRFDLTRFDDAYFARLRERVQLAGERGIYVAVMLFEGWALRFAPESWRHHPFNAANNSNGIDGDRDRDGKGLEIFTLQDPEVLKLQEAYVRRVIDAVNDLDNVLYEIANENHLDSFAWQQHLVRTIRDYERTKPKQHPVGLTSAGYNPEGNDPDTDRLFGSTAEWISPNPNKYDYLNAPPPADGSKVIILDTDHLWGIGGNAAWVWRSFVQGHNPIFMDPYQGAVLPVGDQPERWESVRRALGHTAHFAANLNLSRAAPRPHLASTGLCLAVPGASYLVYLPRSVRPGPRDGIAAMAKASLQDLAALDASVDLSGTAAEFDVSWFNPTTGESFTASTIIGGGRRSFTAPFRGDAVLLLRARS